MYQNIMAQIDRFDNYQDYKKSIEDMFNSKLVLLNHLIQMPEQPDFQEEQLQLLDSLESLEKQLIDSIDVE